MAGVTAVSIDNAMIHDVPGAAINFAPTAITNLSVANSTLQNNATGLAISDNARASVTNVLSANNSGAAFEVTATNASAVLFLFNSTAVNNAGAALQVTGGTTAPAKVRMSNFSEALNSAAITSTGTVNVSSFKNNNLTDAGAPTSTVAQQ
jgi:hypothetical protein